MYPVSPCKNCVAPDRHVGCRNTCPKWPEYLTESHAFRTAVQEAKRSEAICNAFVCAKEGRNLNGSIAKFAYAKREDAHEKMLRNL